MSTRSDRLLIAPLSLCALLAIWMALSAAFPQTLRFSVLALLFANLVVFTDAADFLLRLYVHRRHTVGIGSAGELSIDPTASMPEAADMPIRSYAIIVSVFNLEPQLEQFVEALLPYRDRVWVISDGSTDQTRARLRRAGWRCFDDGVNRHKPGALARLLEVLPSHIQSVLVIDPDIRIRAPDEGSTVTLERVVAEFQRSGAAAVCPRILIERDGFLPRFQALEYALSFAVGRRSLSDYCITSGVALYRRDALARALSRHSLSIYAEDLEMALILLSQGERIYYDGRLTVSTPGPSSWGRWFSQRAGWYYGLIKVYCERFRAILRISRREPFAAYHYLIYTGGLTLGLHLLKMLSALLLLLSAVNGLCGLFVVPLPVPVLSAGPIYVATAACGYFAFALAALFVAVPRSERAYVAPILPLYLVYTLVHIVPMTVGFANWIALRLWGRRLYRDHYEHRERRGGALTPSDTRATGDSEPWIPA